MNDTNFEVIIIGGSYAGLSAAMALGRSLRKVLIIDSGVPCNRQTPHSHNFITQDGEKPAAIALKAKEQVMKYNTVQYLNDLAISGRKTNNGFSITTKTGKNLSANKLIFATGIRDIMPNVKGFADCWGISVVHCPYCHGYEIRKQKTGIMANGEKALHYSGLVNNLTDNLTILTQGKAEFDTEQFAKLEKNKISIIEKEVAAIEHENGYISKVIFIDGSAEKFNAIYAGLPFEQHSQIPADLGCEITETGFIKVDMMQKTTFEGVYACGDNSSGMRSVANAVATGNIAGAVVNKDLVDEVF
ncbi:MAG: NAD(P)/FAD-dependent oxidoreductase [Fulvivirga sp.]